MSKTYNKGATSPLNNPRSSLKFYVNVGKVIHFGKLFRLLLAFVVCGSVIVMLIVDGSYYCYKFFRKKKEVVGSDPSNLHPVMG